MVLQTHGMRDQLEAVAEGTVVLTVEPLGETVVVSEPGPLAAAGAEGGFILQTLWADEPVVEWDELIRVADFAAELAGDFVFFHGIVLLKLP